MARRFSRSRRRSARPASRGRSRNFGSRRGRSGAQTVRLVIQQAPQQQVPFAIPTANGLAALTPHEAKAKARF